MIEPTIFRFEVGRLIHWATRPRRTSNNIYFLLASVIQIPFDSRLLKTAEQSITFFRGIQVVRSI